MLQEVTFQIARRGRATSYTESELPLDYCLEMKNRFINNSGGAEKRQGMAQLGDTITGTPSLDALHELVRPNGTRTIFVSGDGQIWSFDDVSTWTLVHSGLSSFRLQSVMMEDRLIFVNGVDRNFYTKDGVTFTELQAIVERGVSDAGTTRNKLQDDVVNNWATDTFVAINDLVHNTTLDAFAVINAISTASVGHTQISSSAVSAIGVSTRNQASGDSYEIVDLVELNVIPGDNQESDNIAVLASGATDNIIKVSAVADWTDLDDVVELGDYVRNTTRIGIGRITNVSANAVHITGISAQVEGDSVVFLKSAMPIAKRVHVHFGRAYYLDVRNQTKIRISGPNNPEDMTNSSGTLDASTFKSGSSQPEGDTIKAMASFQRFFGIAGERNFYLFSGTDPIQDTATGTIDFSVVGVFPQGTVSEQGLVSIGNDIVLVTHDGPQSVTLVSDSSLLSRSNLAEQIKTTLRDDIDDTPEAQIQLIHYPRRSHLLLKIGSQIHVFNYTAFFDENQLTQRVAGTLTPLAGSWSIYDGNFARQNAYFVRKDASFVCAGDGGKVYRFDNGVFDDDGENYTTQYQTGWLLDETPPNVTTQKQGHYIRPIFDTGDVIDYTVRAEAGFDLESTDSVMISSSGGATPVGLFVIGTHKIGGTTIQDRKFPLRWRGRQSRIAFETEDNKGPDTISRFTLFVTLWGRR